MLDVTRYSAVELLPQVGGMSSNIPRTSRRFGEFLLTNHAGIHVTTAKIFSAIHPSI